MLGKGIISTKTVEKNSPPKNSKKSHFWPNFAVINRKFIYWKFIILENAFFEKLRKIYPKTSLKNIFHNFFRLQFFAIFGDMSSSKNGNHRKYVFQLFFYLTIFRLYFFKVAISANDKKHLKKGDENKNRTKNLLCKSSSCRKMTNLQENNDKIIQS